MRNTEIITNDLIDLLWPLLDNGMSRDEIQAVIINVLDSWEPDQVAKEEPAESSKSVESQSKGELLSLAQHIDQDPYALTPDQWASEARQAIELDGAKESERLEALRLLLNNAEDRDEARDSAGNLFEEWQAAADAIAKAKGKHER